jgi:ATP-dependent Clp protease ATP-binding subunit ClpX
MSLMKHALVRILKEPKNALVNQYKHLFEIDDVELTLEMKRLLKLLNKL